MIQGQAEDITTAVGMGVQAALDTEKWLENRDFYGSVNPNFSSSSRVSRLKPIALLESGFILAFK